MHGSCCLERVNNTSTEDSLHPCALTSSGLCRHVEGAHISLPTPTAAPAVWLKTHAEQAHIFRVASFRPARAPLAITVPTLPPLPTALPHARRGPPVRPAPSSLEPPQQVVARVPHVAVELFKLQTVTF